MMQLSALFSVLMKMGYRCSLYFSGWVLRPRQRKRVRVVTRQYVCNSINVFFTYKVIAIDAEQKTLRFLELIPGQRFIQFDRNISNIRYYR